MNRRLGASIAAAWSVLACNGMQDDTRPAKEPAVPASRVEIVAPTWPAESDADSSALARLPPAARAAVARSPVPALVPRDAALLERAVVSAGEYFYAFSGTAGGINVSIHATRAVHHHPLVEAPPPPERTLRGVPARVTKNEGIWSVSWVEGHVAYNVEAECAHFGDQRCASDGFVVGIAENLAFAGGNRRASEAVAP